ncbi:MSMEG_0570 family nitrogen starvation response protein [Spongisporangium articulatum]|uniref:MSMEG_0570 family nitrogen starvation response protein n=1 Tax=Spongisporangium articulatum TaxID=3362603 RepID=A0ABW8APW3_9ACTN
MPEMYFHVVWPDGARERCYSPSLVVEEYLTPGNTYPVDEFVRLSTEALTIASERVRAKFGFYCTASAATLESIVSRAARQPEGGDVQVESFSQP